MERQKNLPLEYKGVRLDCGYRLDMVVEDEIVVELKTVDKVHPIHQAQIITYLKLSGYRAGLIMNFNVVHFREGLRRIVH